MRVDKTLDPYSFQPQLWVVEDDMVDEKGVVLHLTMEQISTIKIAYRIDNWDGDLISYCKHLYKDGNPDIEQSKIDEGFELLREFIK